MKAQTPKVYGAGPVHQRRRSSTWSPLNATFLALLKRLLPTLSANMSVARITDPLTHRRQTQAGGDHEDIRALMFQRANGSVIGTFANFGIHVELAWDETCC